MRKKLSKYGTRAVMGDCGNGMLRGGGAATALALALALTVKGSAPADGARGAGDSQDLTSGETEVTLIPNEWKVISKM